MSDRATERLIRENRDLRENNRRLHAELALAESVCLGVEKSVEHSDVPPDYVLDQLHRWQDFISEKGERRP